MVRHCSVASPAVAVAAAVVVDGRAGGGGGCCGMLGVLVLAVVTLGSCRRW